MSSTPAEPLFHLGYVSTETGHLGTQGMVELLIEARRVNTERNLTGLLLHREKSFYQVLEGPEEEVKRTFERIERDDRHTAVDVLFEGTVEQREFADWQMGFINPWASRWSVLITIESTPKMPERLITNPLGLCL